MRRVFLEQNLGKKSKCRFPRRNSKKAIIKLGVESQRAVSSPNLTQPLVISGVSVLDFCDRFNQETINLEPGLKIRSKVIVSLATKSFELELIAPSVFELMKRVFQKPNAAELPRRAKVVLQVVHNLSLIKLNQNLGEKFLMKNIKGTVKEVLGSLRSFEEFRVLRKKK